MNRIFRKSNQKGIAHLFALIIVIAVAGIVGFVGYTIWQKNNTNALAKLGPNSCELRGRVYENGTCTKKCYSWAGSLKTDTYDYCSKSVTPASKLNKENCNKLGRKWLSYNGCARWAKQETKANALQCTAGGTYRIHKSFDFCGAKGGARNKFADNLASGGGSGGNSSGGIATAPKGGCKSSISIQGEHEVRGNRVDPDARLVARCVAGIFPGFMHPATRDDRDEPGEPNHYQGKGIDLMRDVSMNRTWDLAKYLRENRKKYNISYIIFDHKIWSVAHNSEGWRKYTGSSNPHTDHIHVEVY